MYKIISFLFPVLLLCGFLSCKKGVTSNGPCRDCLPPITDTGAGTFGCLVNGELFLPKKNPGSLAIPLQCNYQWVDGKIFFVLSAADFTAVTLKSVSLALDNVYIAGPSSYTFDIPAEGNAYAKCKYKGDFTVKPHTTQTGSAGELVFTRFDTLYQIASGTFWFDAVDTATGDTVRVREGRFDVRFTR